MHGYELITELENRSDGRRLPRPAAIYPALVRMEEHGLVEAEEIDGKKRFRLTDSGRRRFTEYRASRGDDVVEPWNDTARGPRGDLRGHVAELVGQARQVGRFGTPEQIEQAAAILTDAKRKLYAVLAAEPGDGDDRSDDG
jgi:DNA-binding PadR family transcriptional regulator